MNPLELILRAVTDQFDTKLEKSAQQAERFESRAKPAINGVGKALETLAGNAKDFSRLFGEMVEAYAGTKIAEFMHSFSEAAADDQARVEALNTALDDMGHGSDNAGEEPTRSRRSSRSLLASRCRRLRRHSRTSSRSGSALARR